MAEDVTSLLISVIIPALNSADTLPRCLKALQSSPYQRWEGIVVDDGSNDGSADLVRRAGMRVVPSQFPHSGPARARNLGAQIAKGDVLLFIDSDVEIRPDCVGRIARVFNETPELVACFGSYDEAPSATNFFSQYKNLFHHFVHQHAREDTSTFWSGCGAIRRDVFLAMGGFDTSYHRPTIEDIELGHRLHQARHQVLLDKRLQVKHLKRWSAISILRSDVFDRGIPWTQLILRSRDFPNDLNLHSSARIGVIAAYAMVLLCLPLALVWQGWWWFVSMGLVALVLYFNLPLYRFFARKRGWGFTLKAIPWHWLYLYYSGFAFAVGLLQHLLDQLREKNIRWSEARHRTVAAGEE